MYVFRWIIASTLFLFFAYFLGGNVAIVIGRILRSKKHHSFAPFLGATSAFVALMVLPVGGTSRYCWVPLVVDPWFLFFIFYAWIGVSRRMKETRLDPVGTESNDPSIASQ